ncbi:VirB4 family type IV secretion system protein [Duganella sp. HH101]|uniref:VirB4 family type IV secretion/conjugal transfer ATPase n=1 Tax=Duganella sp. HH101 TaxID=1781066 RepID=UPI00087474F2|nr:VirB4 family type IV secretion system protein [Duganella sp. HH101]OFA00198.1 type IV secretion system protein virB4 [Duganella sp. HH101]
MRDANASQRIANSEATCADHVPFGALVAPDLVRLRRTGDYLATWRLDGITFETADIAYIAERKEALHNFWRSLGGGHYALWQHKLRREVHERLSGVYDNAFADRFSRDYNASLDGATARNRQMVTELYMSVIYRPAPSGVSRMLNRLAGQSRSARQAIEQEHLAIMEDLDQRLRSSLRRYGPERLGAYRHGGQLCSEMASFYGYLLNGVWEHVPYRRADLAEYLPVSRLHFGERNGMVEIWHPSRTRFAGLLDFQDYPRYSEPGMNNAILYSDYEYIETQSFSIQGKRDALDALKRQQGHLQASEDPSQEEIDDMNAAMEDVNSGAIHMGEYHYSLAVFGDTLEHATRHMAQARTALQEGPGFVMATVDAIPECAWFAQLPGNWRLRPRAASISSRNFTNLAPLHNFAQGKRHGNPWGEALALMQTPSGQPHFFNHHVTPDEEDSTDEKKPGNTTVIGPTGSGKTALVNGLMLFALKYQGLRGVFLDYNRGAEICIRRAGGQYRALKRGEPTGFNPYQLPTHEIHLAFCEKFTQLLAGPSHPDLRTTEEHDISHAVRTVMSDAMPIQLRRLGAVWQNLPIRAGGNSLRDRLLKWTGDHALGWAFDNPVHTHHFDDEQIRIYGYDYTEFIDDGQLCAPIVELLLHLSEKMIDGRPFIYWMEEFWKALRNETLEDFALNKQKTIRKQNGLGVFITQSPSDVLGHKISKTIVEQSATKIFLPNPAADHDDYVQGFKLSEQEFTIIRNMAEDSRLFLLKQGHRSAILRYDLGGMPEILNILSGSLDNVALLDQIRTEVGDDPDTWEPLLHQRIAARRALILQR